MTSSPETVRDATFEVMRAHGLTTVFANPGSTEVPFLGGLPEDMRFVLGLHESAVVGMATGWAIARREAAFVLVHTTAGLGNAVSAIATARVNRAPLVVLVGQQDRRHLAQEPFLTGRLAGLAGDYPVWVGQPARAQDVPGALARARHEAESARGPALVIVPMDDWLGPAPEPHELAAPAVAVRDPRPDPAAVERLQVMIDEASRPALVVGAGADSEEAWGALVTLAERLGCPVWQESFGARAGFPHDHALFAGHLPAGRARLRDALAGHDLVLAVGAPVFRQYPYEPGPFVAEGTRLALVTDDPAEAHRSPVELAVIADPAAVAAALASSVSERPRAHGDPGANANGVPAAPDPPGPGEPLRASHVLGELGARLAPEAVVIEEAPSNRPELLERLPARRPLGFLSPAMGGLGFALPGAIGVRMALPERPVVAVVGDGSAMFGIQSLWSAPRYDAGALFVILSNGGYRVMDRLAEMQGEAAPWPEFGQVDVAAMARALGCPAVRVESHDELTSTFDDVVPGLAGRAEPLLVEAIVSPDPDFNP
ncbi:MAG TPA: thiamine pyrophosphate-dependent enzyme [Thermoleophilaceae bacterium]|jgi:benzoylformate decarboxylase